MVLLTNYHYSVRAEDVDISSFALVGGVGP